ncbi:uncharacterized protein N7484_011059 [Penicillium longicatenatum]|uniref:uncharacterized protein n=1 Tax=Penicillium longicatenatum TaxID=1561947 RepID=UPI002549B15D|nr:uncharacterized protein N7484_011059 [Penicillium longicatenatum]KAJ5630959.1 hypothetical protein N7484_011059 [Penicillium longicatenatum]
MSLPRGQSCILCQQRKVRCDQQKPCTGCVRAQVECKVAPIQPARRKKRKIQEGDLIDRLKKYEALMARNGIDFNSILDNERERNTSEMPSDVLDLSPGPASPKTEKSRDVLRKKSSKWAAYYDEYQTHNDLLQGSDDDEHDQPTIHHAFDKMFENSNDGFPFMVGGSKSPITHLHPSAIQIFQLWQIYLNNVNPLLKISHVPTLQNQIVKASADLAEVDESFEALMFAIYSISVTSMPNDEVEAAFGDSKNELLARYHAASQQALINAKFMSSIELTTLQALLLYLLSICQSVDPRSLFCLIGIAVRVATRLGIHRDGDQFGIPPFETEQRRRLWWQLAMFDKRIAELTGSAITALSSSRTDCRLPLNINDSDLHKHTKSLPRPSTGSTEMLFCLTRVELLASTTPSGLRPDPSIVRNRQENEPLVPPSSFNPSEVNESPFRGLNEYSAYIESTYLQYCDPEIPIQNFALLTARVSLYKLQVVDFMCRGIPTTKLSDQERDNLFMTSVQMIECDDEIYNTKELRGFLWYTQFQAPMPGFFFLMSELRHRTTGPLCERAWKAIFNNHQHRGLIRRLKSPMHTALGQAILKAWEAHEQAEIQQGRAIDSPELITVLRQCKIQMPLLRPRLIQSVLPQSCYPMATSMLSLQWSSNNQGQIPMLV